MKNITLFLCDIEGTYKNDYENKQKDIKEFVEVINKLRKLNNSQKVVFSFMSQSNGIDVQECANTIKPFINESNIVLGKQYYDVGYIINDIEHKIATRSKLSQMLEYIYEMSNKYTINKIYYADDSKLGTYMFKEIAEDLGYDIESINPQNGGCKELTSIINENFLNHKTKKKNYQTK